jgi:hypothetical protein
MRIVEPDRDDPWAWDVRVSRSLVRDANFSGGIEDLHLCANRITCLTVRRQGGSHVVAIVNRIWLRGPKATSRRVHRAGDVSAASGFDSNRPTSDQVPVWLHKVIRDELSTLRRVAGSLP